MINQPADNLELTKNVESNSNHSKVDEFVTKTFKIKDDQDKYEKLINCINYNTLTAGNKASLERIKRMPLKQLN